MKRNVLRPLVVGIAFALASGSVFADPWADQVANSSGVVNAGNALHAPDLSYADMDESDTITVNFLDNICFDSPDGITDGGEVIGVSDNIIGFPDVSPYDVGWANQVTLEAQTDETHLDAVYCDGANVLSWAKFGGVIGDRKIKGNEKTQNVSFKGVAYSAGFSDPDGGDLIEAQVGWLEVNYRNGVSCNFHPNDIGFPNQFYESDGDQRLAGLVEWEYECSNEDTGSAVIVMINAATTSFDLGEGNSLIGVPANGTYYLPDAKGKGRTKFRGAICIWADNGAYSVDGGSNVVYDDGETTSPMCDDGPYAPSPPENSGDLQWGEINIGGNDFIPLL